MSVVTISEQDGSSAGLQPQRRRPFDEAQGEQAAALQGRARSDRRATSRVRMCLALAVLLAVPGALRSRAVTALETQLAALSQQQVDAHGPQETQDQGRDARDREQEKRDREQEARDREQERRDREQEKRDREQERRDRWTELYDGGREALDEDRYDRAEAKFEELARSGGPQADAALYWKAYAENRLGKRDTALATLADLKQRFPQSRWQKDAGALEIEVRQGTGQPAHPDAQSDEELKMLAIQGLMNTDPQKALPLLEKVLNGTGSPREKSKALFVIAQSGSPEARQILGRIASGESNPDLQRKAVEYLGVFGGTEARKTLAEVYAKNGDEGVKRAILRSYMISGDKDDLFAAAKSEKDESLRREAIRQLGLVNGINELQQLYQKEPSPEVRRQIVQAFYLAGDSGRLVEASNGEKDPDLRRSAIRNLGLYNKAESAHALKTIYS
jgi:hypothetical protein